MKHFTAFGLLLFSITSFSRTDCTNQPIDLLVVGDSQTGATWGRSYFGNYLQKCLVSDAHLGTSFSVYGRGGTQPIHWMNNPGMDKIDTILRTPVSNLINLGHEVPVCQKRLKEMISSHRPKKVLVFFGDNVLDLSEKEIASQFERMTTIIKDQSYASQDCYVMTPTYEMSVATRRNVPYKHLANTLKVINAAKKAVGDRCKFIDGIELMKNSKYLLPTNVLKRVEVSGTFCSAGQTGNDNIHVCGEAAQEMAQKICQKLND
jgi:hypothetical protein